MGWEGNSWRVGALLDAHAGEKEHQDAELWAELTARLAALCRHPRYASLMLDPDDAADAPEPLPPGVRDTTVRGLLIKLVQLAEINPDVLDYMVSLESTGEVGAYPWKGKVFQWPERQELELETS